MPNGFRLSFILVISIVSDTIDKLMFTCQGCAFFQFMLACAVRICFHPFTVAMFMVESATSEEPGGHYVVFYFAFFPPYFQFGVKNLFSCLWAYFY